jgi:hypothetical protein
LPAPPLSSIRRIGVRICDRPQPRGPCSRSSFEIGKDLFDADTVDGSHDVFKDTEDSGIAAPNPETVPSPNVGSPYNNSP